MTHGAPMPSILDRMFCRRIEEVEREIDEVSQTLRRLQRTANNSNSEVRQLRNEIDRLLEPCSIPGTVVRKVEGRKVLIKINEGKLVVDVHSSIPMNAIQVGQRIIVHSSTLILHKILPNKVDPSLNAVIVEKVPDVTFNMIGGLQKQIEQIKEVIELPIKHPELFESLGIAQPKGVLLYGPPGTGKTLMVRALAHHASSTFIRISGTELVQKYIGEGARLVRELFTLARENAPAIIFIDEIDSIGCTRIGMSRGDSEVQRTMLELLSQLDGFESSNKIKVIMATNRIDVLDPALLRPGRIDRKIEFPPPGDEVRHATQRRFSITVGPGIRLGKIARSFRDASGAEIKAVCTEAGILALREFRTYVCQEDFEQAVKKVMSKVAEQKNFSIQAMYKLYFVVFHTVIILVHHCLACCASTLRCCGLLLEKGVCSHVRPIEQWPLRIKSRLKFARSGWPPVGRKACQAHAKPCLRLLFGARTSTLFNWPARKNAADFDTVLAQRLRQCELSPLAKPLAPVQSGSAKVHYASPKFTNSPSASCLPPPPEEWLRGHRAPNVQRSAMADGTALFLYHLDFRSPFGGNLQALVLTLFKVRRVILVLFQLNSLLGKDAQCITGRADFVSDVASSFPFLPTVLLVQYRQYGCPTSEGRSKIFVKSPMLVPEIFHDGDETPEDGNHYGHPSGVTLALQLRTAVCVELEGRKSLSKMLVSRSEQDASASPFFVRPELLPAVERRQWGPKLRSRRSAKGVAGCGFLKSRRRSVRRLAKAREHPGVVSKEKPAFPNDSPRKLKEAFDEIAASKAMGICAARRQKCAGIAKGEPRIQPNHLEFLTPKARSTSLGARVRPLYFMHHNDWRFTNAETSINERVHHFKVPLTGLQCSHGGPEGAPLGSVHFARKSYGNVRITRSLVLLSDWKIAAVILGLLACSRRRDSLDGLRCGSFEVSGIRRQRLSSRASVR
uniref:AAA domain-containing protein n=1 Tax=Trichuris muris TaxID=70415 RepID=A0A5S6Q8Z3_TRIMR